ncbi:MAG: MerR family transcriptional regulator [Oleibacter sp.]|nr:MerR family transcriptional regulator [Thalassolituus sp.]
MIRNNNAMNTTTGNSTAGNSATKTPSAEYPIREFSRLSGINPVTLRAWERRYGIIVPNRTEQGHRYYSEEHLEKVRNIVYWLDQGYPIRHIKLLINDAESYQSVHRDEWKNQQDALITALRDLDVVKLDDLLNAGLAANAMPVYFDLCLMPLLDRLRSEQANDQSMLLRVFDYEIKRKLSGLILQQRRHNEGPTLVMATNHSDSELSVLASSYALGAAGFRIEYYGATLLPNDIRIAADKLAASWIWLHAHPTQSPQLQPWENMVKQCRVPVFLSGLVQGFVADDSNKNSKVITLPNSMSKQVQTFITSIGATS